MKNWIKRVIAQQRRMDANDKIIGHVYGMIYEYTLLIMGLIAIFTSDGPHIAVPMVAASMVIATVRQIERDRRIREAGLESTEDFDPEQPDAQDTQDKLINDLWMRRHDLTPEEWTQVAPLLLGFLVGNRMQRR